MLEKTSFKKDIKKILKKKITESDQLDRNISEVLAQFRKVFLLINSHQRSADTFSAFRDFYKGEEPENGKISIKVLEDVYIQLEKWVSERSTVAHYDLINTIKRSLNEIHENMILFQNDYSDIDSNIYVEGMRNTMKKLKIPSGRVVHQIDVFKGEDKDKDKYFYHNLLV